MKFKKIGRTLAAAMMIFAFSASAVAATPSVAHAEETGGMSGGHGNGHSTSAHWESAAGTRGTAWKQFVKSAGWSESNVVSKLNAQKVNVGICRNSTVIWWTQYSSGWMYNWSGTTIGNSAITGTLTKPVKIHGRAPWAAEVTAINKWLNGRKNPVVLCSQNDPAPQKVHWSNFRNTYTSTKDTYSKTGVYSNSTTVVPMLIEGKYVGDSTPEAQSSTTKTSFGRLYDSIAAGKDTISYDDLKKKADAAVAADAASSASGKVDMTVNLSDKNKSAFAKGGIFNISEFQASATLVATRTNNYRNDQRQDCTRTDTWDQKNGGYKAGKSVCGRWYNRSQTIIGVSNNLTKNVQTQKNVGFWQMISVHCNKQDFEKLVSAKATGATVINSGDSTNGISAVAKSKLYTAQPTTLDFGDEHNPNADAAKSSTMGFFDKECPFDCTASTKTADGASADNGATKNSGTTGTTNGSKNGAVSGSQRGNNFTFFRDNTAKDVSVDVWYPKTTDVVDYKSSPAAAITTTITRWATGTPGTQTTEGGKFIMKTKDSTPTTLFTGSTDAVTQKNWDTTTFSNANSTALTGLHRLFTVQSSWASENGKPQVLNVKYEYAPAVTTSFPTAVGFGTAKNNLTQVSDNASSSSANIQGKCYATFGADTNSSTSQKFHDYTGSGTTNTLDKSPVDGASVGEGNANIPTNLVLKFVRATTN